MFAFIDFVNIARPFVGRGPNVKTFIPPETKPDTIEYIIKIVRDKK